MKRLLLLVCLLALPGPLAAEPAIRTLEAGAAVDGLRVADVDRDGVEDLLLIERRTVRLWRGRRGELPTSAADWSVAIEAGVSFVDVRTAGEAGLLTLGREGTRSIALTPREGAPGDPPGAAGTAGLSWRDGERAIFAPLTHERGRLSHTREGVLFTPHGRGSAVRVPLSGTRDVTPAGPFLEDTCAVVTGLPAVFVGRPAAERGPPDGLWALDGPELVCVTAEGTVRYDISFLSAGAGESFDQTLVDLDGDRRPDVLHRIHSNREARYGFFHTRPAAAGATRGPSHKPPASTLFLSGFQLEPDLVDLDGDGLKDLVVTSMQINAANMLGALTSGKVTAETRAFLNRWARGDGSYFDGEPDALVKSQIDVKVQFNFAGNIEVVRSFLILLDGDFDGDGRRDLAIRTGPSTLSLRRGVAAGVWAGDDAAVDLAIPAPRGSPDVEGYAADLDGDGRDEIALIYRKPPGGKDRVVLLDPGW